MCDFDSIYTYSEKQKIQLSRELKIDDVVEKAITQMFDSGKIDEPTRDALFLGYNAPLQDAVVEGYGKPLAKIEYGTPNYEFLKQLQTNTAVFSMFKTHASMKEMAALIKDKEGNVRTREQFKAEALKVDKTFRHTHLEVQYDTGVRTARLASKWQKFQQNKHLYPNLKYLMSKAAKPDKQHLSFVGIIRPVDDIFWQKHYPPNRWRCQCDVEQTDDGATDLPGDLPAIGDDFAFNAGAIGQVFDLKNSEYIKSVPPKDQPALIKKAKALFQADQAAELPYHTLYKSKNGGSVTIHPATFIEKDLDNLVKNARALANQGKDVKMLPAVKNPDLRKALLPKEMADKLRTADFIVDDMIMDLKVMQGTSKNTVKQQLSGIKGQTNNLIIEATDAWPYTKYQTIKMLKQKMMQKEMEDFGEVWINYKGKWLFNPHKSK